MKLMMLGSGSYRSSLSIRLVSLAQRLATMGWEVSVVVPSADKYNDFTKEHLKCDGAVRVVQPWQPATRSASFNLLPYLLTSLATILSGGADVVYLYKPTPITILGLLPKLLFRTPVILDLDDLGSEVMRAEAQSSLRTKLVAMCERLATKYATAIVVTSTFLQERVARSYPDKPVLLLPNGIEPELYPARSSGPLRPAVYYFGMINRLSLIEPLLRAVPLLLEQVPGAKLTIIGGGIALDEAKALIKKLGVDRAVNFTGPTDMLGVLAFTQFGDVGICYQPDVETVRAASNMKVFQYMAMTTVPVVSAVGDLPLYLDGERAGLVVPANDEVALAEAIAELLTNNAMRVRCALNARQRAVTRYSWSSLAAKLGSFIEGQKKEIAS
jgi:glycosyltransferase involved in cell wall biosynthesis